MDTTERTDTIQSRIHLIRGRKVMLDSDLAELYGITTGNLNKAVTRNIERFPENFMFRLTSTEFKNLIFHFGTSKWGGTRKLPRAFTEHGILMLSSVLSSKKAIQINIQIMEIFIKMRRMLETHKELMARINDLEQKYDTQFKIVFDAIRQLMEPPDPLPRRKIGFK